MVDGRRPETLTETYYDPSDPVTPMEDQEACEIAIGIYSSALEDECKKAREQGWAGWNRPTECTIDHLVEKMKKAFLEGDIVKIGVYGMMLYSRGCNNFEKADRLRELAELSNSIADLVVAEEQVAWLNGDELFNSTLRAIRAKMSVLECKRVKLLKLLG